MKGKNNNRPHGPGGAAGSGRGKSSNFNRNYIDNRGRVPVYVSTRAVGYVEAGTFVKQIRGSKHLLRKPPAIAFDTSSLRDAEMEGAVLVRVIDTETGKEYEAAIDQIWTEGFRLNRGYGTQQALPLSRWNCGNEPAQQLSLFEVTQ